MINSRHKGQARESKYDNRRPTISGLADKRMTSWEILVVVYEKSSFAYMVALDELSERWTSRCLAGRKLFYQTGKYSFSHSGVSCVANIIGILNMIVVCACPIT